MLRRNTKNTLLPLTLAYKAANENLHLLHRLLVAFSLGGGNPIAPCGERFALAARGGERLPQELPGGGIGGIERDRALQVRRCVRRITLLQVLVADSEAQQRSILPRCEHALEILQRCGHCL